MEPLHFRNYVDFKYGETHSVCLRGARRYPISKFGGDVLLYTPTRDKVPQMGSIVSQKQYAFHDLLSVDWEDNYDETARTHEGLLASMIRVYPDFDPREIVTVLRFKVESE